MSIPQQNEANLLTQDNNGFNKYHASIVYNDGDIANLEKLLNDEILLKENPQIISRIFMEKSNHSNIKLNILEMAFLLQKIDNIRYIKVILKSKAFKKLDKVFKTKLLTEGEKDSPLIQSMLKDDGSFQIIMDSLHQDEKSAIFEDITFTKQFVQTSINNKPQYFTFAFNFLSDIASKSLIMQVYEFGVNLLDFLIKLQGNHSSLIEIVIKAISNFSEEEIKQIIAPQGQNSLLKNLVTLNGNHRQDLELLLESKAFKKLDKVFKTKLLTEGEKDSPLTHLLLNIKNDYIKILLDANDQDINQLIVENIKNIPADQLTKFKDTLIQSGTLKDTVDSNGFSSIYHLKQRALTESDIQYLKNIGYQEILPDGYTFQQYDTHMYYSSTNSSKNALIFIGEDHNGANDTPIVHTFLMKGYNVIVIDARIAKSQISADVVYAVTKDYSQKNIDLFIIESHGSENSLTDNKHSIPIYGSTIEKTTETSDRITTTYSSNSIETTKFLKNLSAAVGNKPISVLLSSCEGQLAVRGFEKNLPSGSEILTMGEYQTLLGKQQNYHTIDSNIRNFLNYLFERKDLNVNNLNLKNLSIIYSNKIINGTANSGYGSPYYSKLLENGLTDNYSCITVDPKIILNLCNSLHQKADLLNIVCGNNDNSCKEKFSKEYNTLLSNPELYSTENLMNLRDNNNVDDYATKLSLKCWLGSLINNENDLTIPDHTNDLLVGCLDD